MRSSVGACLGAGTLAALAASPAIAQSGWEFQLAPYAWLAGIDGDIGALPVSGLPPQSVSLSFGDVLDDLDFAGMLFGSARRASWVFFLDATYVKTTSKDAIPPVVDRLTATSQTTTLALAAGRTLSDGEHHRVDAYVGARAWWLDNDFKATIAPAFGGGQLRAGTDADWIDPLVGVAATYAASDAWSLFGSAEIGGFGAGADFEWSAMAGATWSLGERWGLVIAYRALGVDYSGGGVVYDVVQSGPVVGATIKF